MKQSSSLGGFSRGALISVVGVVLGGIFSYLTRKILVVHLSTEEYGFFYSIFSLACFGLALSDVGLGRSTTILMAKSVASENFIKMRQHFNVGFWFKAASSFFLALLFAVVAPIFFRQENVFVGGHQTLMILALFLPLQSLSGLFTASLNALQRYSARSIYQTLYFFIVMAVVLTGSFTTNKLLVPAIAYLLAALVLVVAGYYHLSKYSLKISFQLGTLISDWRENWFYAKWISLTVLAINTMNYLDTVMLFKVGGVASAAGYQVALPVAQIGRSFIVIPVIFAPVASDLWQKNRPNEIARICHFMTLAMLFFAGVLVMLLLPFAGDLLAIMFDERYRYVSRTLLILGGSMPILLIAEFYLNTLNAIEKPEKAAKVALSGMVLNIVFNFILIPRMGSSGAALATFSSYALIAIFAYTYLRKDISLRIPIKVLFLWLPVILYGGLFVESPGSHVLLVLLVVVYIGAGIVIGYREFFKLKRF